jgi:hypothetical protein
MGNKYAVVFCYDFAEFDKLTRIRVDTGRINHTGAHAIGAGIKGFLQFLFHFFQLVPGGFAIVQSHNDHAKIAVRCQIRQIRSQRQRIHLIQVFVDRFPVPVEIPFAFQSGHGFFPGRYRLFIYRCRSHAVLCKNLCGDALIDFRGEHRLHIHHQR